MYVKQYSHIQGALLLSLDKYADHRGYFEETYNYTKYGGLIPYHTWMQGSASKSHANVLRGLHGDYNIAKLVSVLHGSVYDVIVDMRKESPSYLQWDRFYLSGEQYQSSDQVYIPAGCAHGFLSLEDNTVVNYLQSAPYNQATEFGVRYDDPVINIQWKQGITGNCLSPVPILSDKDQNHPYLPIYLKT